MNGTISIITPCYNHRRYIGFCIESVLAQSYADWELIVVDDGSTDGSPDLVAAYADPRIRLIRLPHRGLPALADSYNAALRAATGQFVAVLEGDDAWPADKLAVQVAAFADPAVELSWGRGQAIDVANRPIKPLSTIRSGARYVDLTAADAFAELARTNIIAPAASVIVRRDALDAVGGFQQEGSSHYVDLPTWLTMAARGRGIFRFVNHELALYRIHESQVSQRFGPEMAVEAQRIVEAVVRRLGPDDLQRLDWATVGPRVQTAAMLARGRNLLSEQKYSDARAEFTAALTSARNGRDVAKAGIGALSAIVHRDLLSLLFDRRARYIAGE